MAQAKITINAVVGSNVNLPINTLVNLSNQNNGGEVTYLWAILDQPPGAPDSLSATNVQNVSFTPKKEGTYVLKLTVNQSLGTEQSDIQIVGIKQLKTLTRVPGAGETNQGDASEGWSAALNEILRKVDNLSADAGILIGKAGSPGLTRGKVLRCTGVSTIKTGLPGEEKVPVFTLCNATTLANIDELIGILEGGVDGSTTPANGDLVKVRIFGRFNGLTGMPALNIPVYVSAAGDVDVFPGTYFRTIGSVCASSGATYDVWVCGTIREPDTRINSLALEGYAEILNSDSSISAGGAVRLRSNGGKLQASESGGGWVNVLPAAGGSAPVDANYLTQGSNGTLTNEVDITGLAAVLPFTRDDATTNTVLDVVSFLRSTSGMAAGAGIGAGILLRADNSTSSAADAARIAGILTTETAGNEASALSFATRTGGGALTERWRVLATGELAAQGGNRKIQNVADPAADQDAVTRAFYNTRTFKDAVRVASTADVTVASPAANIDGVALSSGDRVLLKSQATASQNGIYVWNGAMVAMTRAVDADTSAKVLAGMQVRVGPDGTANPNTSWTLTTANPINLGVTNLTFSPLPGSFRQSVFAEISADTTTASAAFVDLISQAITFTAGGILLINFTSSVSNSGANNSVDFQITVDAVAKRGASVRLPAAGSPNGAAIVLRVAGLGVGAHTVKVQWRTAAGTAQIRPVTTITEHASLLLEEVTV